MSTFKTVFSKSHDKLADFPLACTFLSQFETQPRLTTLNPGLTKHLVTVCNKGTPYMLHNVRECVRDESRLEYLLAMEKNLCTPCLSTGIEGLNSQAKHYQRTSATLSALNGGRGISRYGTYVHVYSYIIPIYTYTIYISAFTKKIAKGLRARKQNELSTLWLLYCSARRQRRRYE